jgi:DNA-binding NarL/FixJ family response regulator
MGLSNPSDRVGVSGNPLRYEMPDLTELTVLVIEHQDVLFHSLEQYVLKLVPSAHIEHIRDLDGARKSAEGSNHYGLVILDGDIPGLLTSPSHDIIVESLAQFPLAYLTNTFREMELTRLLQIGVNAYLPKTIPAPVMIAGFGLALCGQRYFAPRHMPRAGEDERADSAQSPTCGIHGSIALARGLSSIGRNEPNPGRE